MRLSHATALAVTLALAVVTATSSAAEASPHVPAVAKAPVTAADAPGGKATPTKPRPVRDLWRPIASKATLPGGLAKANRPQPTPPPPPTDCRKAKCVALTFDDGPGPYSVGLARQLHARGAKATFYMVGRMVSEDPRAVKAIAAIPGMEIGAHTMTHPELTKIAPSVAEREIGANTRALRALVGPSVRTMRPPYGDRDARTDQIAARHGLSVIMWDVDTLDWQSRSTPITVSRAVKGARPGSIILMHDIHAPTVKAAPWIATELQRRGYTLVTVSELFGTTRPGRVYTNR